MNNDNKYFSTMVNDNDQVKSNKFKNIVFVIIILIIVCGLIYGSYYLFLKNNSNVSLNPKGKTTSTTSTFVENYCNKVNLDTYLRYFNLSNNNINLLKTDYNDGYTYNFYNMVYEGFILTNTSYMIISLKDVIYCSYDNDNTEKMPTYDELGEIYNALSIDDVRTFLNYSIYDKFAAFNKMTNLQVLSNFYKKMNLSQDELNNEIKNIEDYYDEYKLEVNDSVEIKFGKNAIKNAILSVYS